ncbi:hypothetical protein D3C80_1033310 [compost metagenome]
MAPDAPGVAHAAARQDDVPVPQTLQTVALLRPHQIMQARRMPQFEVRIARRVGVPASAQEDVGGLDRQRGVQKDVGRQFGRRAHHGQNVQHQVLGPADGEGRHQQGAARRLGLAHLLRQGVPPRLGRQVLPLAIAVGAFEDDMIDADRPVGARQQGLAARAQVAREEQAHRLVRLPHRHLDRRRAEKMARRPPARRHPRQQFRKLSELHRLEQPQRGRDVGDGVDGLDRLDAAPLVAPVQMGHVPFLDLGGVGQHDLAQVPRGARRIDGVAIAGPRQLGQQAGMIDVGVGQEDGVDRRDIKGKWPVVQRLERL